MSRRGTTPSLEASQQSHINDLVQRNRALEHTIKKLKDELTLEKSRSKNAINDIHTKWTRDQEAWRDGCDTLQNLHRIEQLRLQVALEKEKSNVLNEQGFIRKEKLANIQRDFRITSFQIRESELERRVEELEDELDEAFLQHKEESDSWKTKANELLARLTAQEAELDTGEQEIGSRDAEISNLHKALAEQQAVAQSTAAKLERATLQLDGERTKNADLQRTNDEFKRTNQDLTRQLDKWQSLETKGGEEVEALRKQKVDLDIRLQALQNQQKKREEDHSRQMDRERNKVEKLKKTVDQWAEHSQTQEKEIKSYEKTIAKLEKEIDKARSELETERTRGKSLQKVLPIQMYWQSVTHFLQKKKTPPPDTSEDEVEQEVLQAPPSPPVASGSRSKLPPSSPISRTGRRVASKDIANSDDGDQPKLTAKGKGKATDNSVEITQKPRPKPAAAAKSKGKKATDSEIEEIPKAVAKGRDKKKKEAVMVHDSDSDTGSPPQHTSKAKGKSKAQTPPDDLPQQVVPKAKRKKQDASDEGTMAPKATRKPASRATSIQSTATTVDTDVGSQSASTLAGNPRKKRRINIFADKSSLASLNFGSQENGLNIPTVLSPVREENVPRATASALSRLSQPFGRR
ncbi:hypothetical protein K435DRAFT_959998 [Dendrothele bispora CBS 962.96]|uniref:Uncharacterized protein n=1 Tax=Dendrothele bispora (strain CBS 962.96) TaxID=1314807 RepID=A0A4S8MY53_DENBC|nr:hypothetical protein K435DRAFT_959998 [Dendrothele bispora CBS 962.96]